MNEKSSGPLMAPGTSDVASQLRVILDFDGTLVDPNVAIILVEEFAPNGREVAHEIDILLHEGKIGLREAWRRQVALLSADRMGEMIKFARHRVPLRKGAHEMLALLKQHQIPVTVVSGGLEFYIREVLEREGLDLPIQSDRLTVLPSGQMSVVHPFEHPTCRLCGICKAGIVDDRSSGRRSVFIADGSTDRYGAESADIVFARRRLLEFCRRVGIPSFPFEDFEPVTAQLTRWLEGTEPLPIRRAGGLADSPCPISQALVSTRAA
ncbi:MAG: HAD-IB family phosphatase [Thermoplasmata archaeon]|nr:HAD-IB family phosphatase [Thermoplasmata archaeon]